MLSKPYAVHWQVTRIPVYVLQHVRDVLQPYYGKECPLNTSLGMEAIRKNLTLADSQSILLAVVAWITDNEHCPMTLYLQVMFIDMTAQIRFGPCILANQDGDHNGFTAAHVFLPSEH